MQIPWAEVGLVLVLVVVNAAFAGSEVALISLREGQLRRLEHEGGRGRLVAQLARDPNQFLSTIQIGITLAGFLASAAAAVALAEPAVWLLSKSTDLLVRLAGGDPNIQRETVTEEEVRDLVAIQAGCCGQHRTILVGALEITERVLRDVLVPRRQVVALAANTPVQNAVRALVSTTHGRAPVYRGDLDEIIGVAHLVDMVDARG